MSSLEKTKKKSKKSKKNKKAKKTNSKKASEKNENTEVLERVMQGIEMAGASLSFFEGTEDEAAQEALAGDDQEKDHEIKEPDRAETTEEIGDPQDDKELELPEDEDQPDKEELSGEEGENLELLEADENSAEFVEYKQACSIIESLLFSSDRPLGLGTFKQVFKGTNFKSKDIKKALEEMQSVYADPARGVSLEEINGGWQLRTKVDNMDFLRKLAKARPFKLSGPALEVLAIIAYKQPLVKSEVDEIRGVESGHLVRALMEKNLVTFQGKSELPGKPMQYGTTRKFLEIFGLRNLRELPSLDEIDQLIPEGMGFEEEDEKLSDVTDSMSENYDGNYSEGEEELLKIEDTLEGIDTSSEFFEQEKQRQKDKRDRERAQDIREALEVGEEVEAKDERWLARYDEKIAAEQAEKEAQAQEAQQDEEQAQFQNDLQGLTNENLVSEQVMQQDEDLEMADANIEAESALAEEAVTDPNTDEISEEATVFDPFSDDDE